MRFIKNTWLFVFMFTVAACQMQPQEQAADTSATYKKISGSAFGTIYNITYKLPDGRFLKNEVDSVLAAFDASLSTYNPNSLITKINNGEDVKTDATIRKVFERSIEISKATSGLFDVTIAPIVNAWGFGFKNKENITEERVKELLQFVGYKKVKLVNGKIEKETAEVMFDFNAIAKGFGVDVVADYLSSQGSTDFLVEIGGEIVAKGKNSHGNEWRVGVDKPIDNAAAGEDLQTVIQFSDRAMATSGNYRRFYVNDGVKYSHTINPKTGYPVQHSLLSATVIAKDCMTADAYATAFMVMGVEKTQRFLAQTPEKLEVYLIYSDAKGEYLVWQTEGMKKLSK